MMSRFAIVGCLGFVLQLLTLWALTSLADWPWLPATAAAVEIAVLHNFAWHERWTWADRGFGGFGGFARFARLLRFNVATGLISILGNLALMAILVEVLRLPAVVGNAIAVAVLGVVNFVVADRWVFTVGCGVAMSLLCAPVDASAGPSQATLNAWDAYVAGAETRLDRTPGAPSRAAARSVATRIEEVGGADHGFLWRLNSYWRYEQRDGGVLVELESLTLSRDMPSLLRPITSPLVRRIARESMARTLDALQRQYASG